MISLAACNKEAGDKNLKGDQRKTFMSQRRLAHRTVIVALRTDHVAVVDDIDRTPLRDHQFSAASTRSLLICSSMAQPTTQRPKQTHLHCDAGAMRRLYFFTFNRDVSAVTLGKEHT